jgi:UDP-N-acetylglucosamine acyltransferase
LIDALALVHPDARLGTGVSVGPYSIVEAGVEIGDGTRIGPHAVIRAGTRIGARNRVFQYCSIGEDPQDKKYGGEPTRLEIGDDNVIREFCTLNRGTAQGGGVTRIGDRNWIMAYTHIAHDCAVGSGTVFANHATLAGHVVIEDHAILGGFAGVHQFCRVGAYSFAAISSVIVKDVPPFVLVAGNTAKPTGLNREGLRRHAFDAADIDALRRAYRAVYRDKLLLKDALVALDALGATSAAVARFAAFIRGSERGIVR